MFSKYISFIENLLSKIGLNENVTTYISEAISLITLIVITLVLYHAVLFVIRKTIYIFIEKSESKRDDILIKNKVFNRLCLLVPAYLIRFNIEAAAPSFPADSQIMFLIFFKLFLISLSFITENTVSFNMLLFSADNASCFPAPSFSTHRALTG